MILSKYIAEFIDTLWWEYVFGVCGIPNLPIYEELHKRNVKLTQNTHEAFSIFSCIWAYNYTKKIHFSVVTAWPWVTNTITPLSEAFISNIPVFLISINSDSDFYATGEKHDSSSWDLWVDTVSLTKDITCFSAVWLSAKNTILLLERAYKLCISKSKPVHVSLPRDFLTQDIWTPPETPSIREKNKQWTDISYSISQQFSWLWKTFDNSLFVINTDEDISEILEALEKKNIFLANTSKSIWNIEHIPSCVWSFEYVQSITTIKVLKNINTIVVLGWEVNRHFFQNIEQLQWKEIIHITDCIENTENIQNNKNHSFRYNWIIGDVKILWWEIAKNLPISKHPKEAIEKLIQAWKKHYHVKFQNNINYQLFQSLNTIIPENSSLFIGVWWAHNYANTFLAPLNKINTFIPSRFFNMWHCMKVIWYAHYNKSPNFVIMGDWNYYMNGNDILTAVEKKLNINFFILNNKWYSSLSSWRDEYLWEIKSTDYNNYNNGALFEKIAESMGCCYLKISQITDINTQLENIDLYNWINIIEVVSDFNESIPL